MFLPVDAHATAGLQDELASLLRAAARKGVALRVAVIPSQYDLGSVTSLWRKPRVYARFLAVELSGNYRGAVLVAMPAGFGVSTASGSPAAAYERLARIAIGPGGRGLLVASTAAVRDVAAADGRTLTAPGASGGPTGGGPSAIVIVAGVAVAVLLGGAALVAWRRRSRFRAALQTIRGRARPALPRAPARRFLVLNAGLGVALIAALTLVWLSLSRGGTQAAPSAPASTQTPFTFAPHHRRAAAFRLTDQGGRPVSLTAYRGRPVIVTFIDPLCRNLCPLAAHVLNQLDRQLPPARRVPIIAVSVDVYADSRADLIQDYSRWRLVPQWHWAVGNPARLAAVWRSYSIGVQVVTKRIAGTTVHFIYHDEVAYVVDPEGYARALFFWPYDAAGIERTLAEVARA